MYIFVFSESTNLNFCHIHCIRKYELFGEPSLRQYLKALAHPVYL